MEHFEVVVIGAGAAGLSAALLAGRACRRVLVLDGGAPRNAPAAHMHSVLSRDGTPPLDYLAEGRAQLATYDVTVRAGRVERLTHVDDRVVLRLASGEEVGADAVIAATGVTDHLPDVSGLAEGWGDDVAHCPYCHGWEVRGRRIGVLGSPGLPSHYPVMISQWSDHVTYLTQGEPVGDHDRLLLEARGVHIIESSVLEFVREEGRMTGARFDDGSTLPIDAIFTKVDSIPNDQFLRDAGAEVDGDTGNLVRDAMGKTTLDNVWIAGDARWPLGGGSVTNAVSEGAMAATAANVALIMQDAERAVSIQG